MMAIWFVILVALVGLGGLAAVVFAIVYAIANKKPGVALAAVLLPLGAIVTVGLLGALLIGRASYVRGPAHTNVQWAINAPPSPPSPPSLPAPMHDVNPLQVDPDLAIWFLVLAAGLVAAFVAFRKSGCANGRRGWGKAVVIGLMLFIGAKVFFASLWHRSSVVHGQAQAQQEMAEQIRLDVENAERKAIEAQHAVVDAQRKAEEASQEKAASEHGIKFKTMQELWEKLNQPRIKLDSDDKGASMEAGVEGKLVKIEAPINGESQLIVPISSETPESLDRSLARLERMVERVSEMADQVSDAGTLVGKAMIALNDTIDSRGKSKAKVETVAAVVEKTPEPTSEVPEAGIWDPQARGGAVPSRIEIRLNDKASEFNVSINDITKALRDDYGFEQFQVVNTSEGTTVRAIGEPTERFASEALEIVVGHVGSERRPVLLGDIATINDVTPQLTGNSTRPSWVDLPAKRVGNAQRRVIVAGDFATREECDREADRLLMLAVAEHLAAITGTPIAPAPSSDASMHDGNIVYPEADRRLYLLQRMNLGLDFVRREIAQEEYEETVELSFGPMKRLYTRLEFTPSIDNELRMRWDEFRREKRFAMVGMGAGSVLGLLGMAFGLLKVDTWTKGYYTKRLFLGVPAAIIGLVGLLGLAVS